MMAAFKEPRIKLFNYSTLRQGNGARFNTRQREDSAVTVTIYYVHFGNQSSGLGVRANPFTNSHITQKFLHTELQFYYILGSEDLAAIS